MLSFLYLTFFITLEIFFMLTILAFNFFENRSMSIYIQEIADHEISLRSVCARILGKADMAGRTATLPLYETSYFEYSKSRKDPNNPDFLGAGGFADIY